MHEPTDSDKFQGVIRNPIAFYFPIQSGFSGPIQTLHFAFTPNTRGPLRMAIAIATLVFRIATGGIQRTWMSNQNIRSKGYRMGLTITLQKRIYFSLYFLAKVYWLTKEILESQQVARTLEKEQLLSYSKGNKLIRQRRKLVKEEKSTLLIGWNQSWNISRRFSITLCLQQLDITRKNKEKRTLKIE